MITFYKLLADKMLMVTGEYQIVSHLYSPISQSQNCFICLWSPVIVIRKNSPKPVQQREPRKNPQEDQQSRDPPSRIDNMQHISYRLCMPLVKELFKSSGGNLRIF